jgi:hypothetical protein
MLLEILFLGVDYREWTSLVLALLARLVFIDIRFVHAMLKVDNYIFHLTWDGVETLCLSDEKDAEYFNTIPVVAATTVTVSDEDAFWMRLKSVDTLKLNVLDLVRVGLRLNPIGFTCSSFIFWLLTGNVDCYTPSALFREVTNGNVFRSCSLSTMR